MKTECTFRPCGRSGSIVYYYSAFKNVSRHLAEDLKRKSIVVGEQLQAGKIAQLEHQYRVLEERQKALVEERNVYREKARAYDIFLREREGDEIVMRDDWEESAGVHSSDREGTLNAIKQERDRLRVDLLASRETAETHAIDLWQLEQINTVIVGAHNRLVEEKRDLTMEIRRLHREKLKQTLQESVKRCAIRNDKGVQYAAEDSEE
ncbi:hypothetical protein QFC20_004723 [Naganishia adeliensis]|uniref:Uncharacterized protein n=1 Tax=Naganishia adeliensis TaxID=92952 RepID=A0ACC2VW97_9TREE|nr:hypothetical protein QFC20_004723 [Naganishia adeliensis]